MPLKPYPSVPPPKPAATGWWLVVLIYLLALVGLKLFNPPFVATWSWWQVLAPFWTPWLVVVLLALAGWLLRLLKPHRG